MCYNLTVTVISVLVTFLIGGVELVQVLSGESHLSGAFWNWINGLNFESLSLGAVVIFIISLSHQSFSTDAWASSESRTLNHEARSGSTRCEDHESDCKISDKNRIRYPKAVTSSPLGRGGSESSALSRHLPNRLGIIAIPAGVSLVPRGIGR